MKVWREKGLANLANSTKLSNFICQASYNSATIISILTIILPNKFFMFSPNFSLTKLLSYMVSKTAIIVYIKLINIPCGYNFIQMQALRNKMNNSLNVM